MNRAHFAMWMVVLVLGSSSSLRAQQAAPSTTDAAVPTLVQFSGVLTDVNGKPLTGVVGVTFMLYKDQQGGAPLWLETQNVQPSTTGRYSVMLGATSSTGLPADLFAQGEARWLGVQAQGQEEQPRVMLLSVPYAMKAADAQTLGGLPASAFVLAAPPSSSAAAAMPEAAAASAAATVSSATTSDVTTSGGTANTIPLFSTATNIQNSLLTQTGTTAINVGGKLNLPALGTASSTAGFNSRPLDFVASAYNTTTDTAVPQTFQWQAEALNNDKTTATGTLNLLYASGTASAEETGLKISNKGLFTFASGQAFPGTGTITGITTPAGSGLKGGGTSGALNLSIPAAGVTNAMLANSSLTVNPGGGMTGGGKIALGGSATLGLENCSANQVLKFVGTAWTCANAAVGTITGVTAGSGLSGGGSSGGVTLNNTGILALTAGTGVSLTGGQSPTVSVNTSQVPLLSGGNQFTGIQTINGGITIGGAGSYTLAVTTPGGGIQAGAAEAGYAILGQNNAGGQAAGVEGTAASSGGYGVLGTNTSTSGNAVGVYGQTSSPSGYGVYSNGNLGVVGSASVTAPGSSGLAGVVATGGTQVIDVGNGGDGGDFTGGAIINGNGGYYDYGGSGVSGTGGGGQSTDVGGAGGTFQGGTGWSGSGDGVNGTGGNGLTTSGGGSGAGVSGTGGIGTTDGPGGYFTGGNSSQYGDGVTAFAGSGYAGNFSGNVNISGSLSKASGSFKIDHPLDPANKYLYHSFVESPDMMNVYNGNAVLDSNGEAVVDFPEWFGVLNRDFRYQLTCIGGFAPVYVAEEIRNNRFKIAGGRPGLKVSWQVTGIRQDAWANAHRIPVEEEKEPRLRGFYLHPELYGAPPEKQIEWARHPEMMKRMKEHREAQRAGTTVAQAQARQTSFAESAPQRPPQPPAIVAPKVEVPSIPLPPTPPHVRPSTNPSAPARPTIPRNPAADSPSEARPLNQ